MGLFGRKPKPVPEDPEAAIQYVYHEILSKKSNEDGLRRAEEIADRLIAKGKVLDDAYVLKGDIEPVRENYIQMLEYYLIAIGHCHKPSEHISLGWLFPEYLEYKKKDFVMLEKFFSKMYSKQPDAFAAYHLAGSMTLQGRVADGERFLEDHLSKYPEHRDQIEKREKPFSQRAKDKLGKLRGA